MVDQRGSRDDSPRDRRKDGGRRSSARGSGRGTAGSGERGRRDDRRDDRRGGRRDDRGNRRDRGAPGDDRGDRRDARGGRRDDRGETGFGPYGKPAEDRRRTRRTASGPTSEAPEAPARRPALRTVGERPAPTTTRTRRGGGTSPAPARRRRRRGPADVELEIRRLAGRNGDRFLRLVMDAADAFAQDRERDALRFLRPVREQLPNSPSVRELAGLCQYRLGNYAAAARELEAYAELSGSVDQNPVLMDCYRAQRRWRKVDEKWDELRQVSPSAAAIAEGRIVAAGALADRGRLDEALAVMRARSDNVRNPKEHHLRLWYALADLEERAGNHAVARDLFDRVRRADPGYADVAERRAALG